MMRPEKKRDTEFMDHTIERVTTEEGEFHTVIFDGGMCFGIPSPTPIVPKIGMTLRLYGKGFGFPIRGVDLDGVEVYYRTADEEAERHRKQFEQHEQEQRYDFQKNRASFDARYRALPAVFQRRLDKFRKNNPDFRWKYEDYEMFCCEQAVVLATALKTPEKIIRFASLKWDEQRKLVPQISGDHSGNTFGFSARLAMLYLGNPEDVVQIHGALAPLVGSEEYGCVPRGKTTK